MGSERCLCVSCQFFWQNCTSVIGAAAAAAAAAAVVAGHRPATTWVHYTTSCNKQSSAPEGGRNSRPKHVALVGIINKLLLLHLVCVYIIFINDAQSNKHQIPKKPSCPDNSVIHNISYSCISVTILMTQVPSKFISQAVSPLSSNCPLVSPNGYQNFLTYVLTY